MAIGAKKIREARKKYLASLSPEERDEIDKEKKEAEAESKKRWEKLGRIIDEKLKANAHHEKAIGILKEAVQLAASDPAMTPEVKELADMIVFLIEDRNLEDYTFDGIMEPLIKIVAKDTKSQSASHAAKAKHEEDKRRREEIRAIWAKGNFSTRSECAEQEWGSIGFGSYDTARKALKNTPNPFPWPAKKKS